MFSSVVVREAGKETCEMEGRIRFRLLLYSVKQWQDAIIEKAVLITQSQYGWADNGYAQKTVVSTRQQLPVVHTAGFSSDNNLKKSIATFKNHQMGVPYFDDATYENDTYIPFTVEDEYSIYTETNSIKAINRMYRADPKVKLWKNIYAYLERLNNF
ncbi:MAG: hypothetical protein P0Y53_09895 [Candidatus Pseudobacter hemicellulosilyticus]|uniref:Uncharacterized protein n=1 Tax=Candidatus Pseudobacter hemicellulosilyticus TaxID=3121375 RepID=A0AAJ5WYI7_9BACT|nr:MAG: hypothetical protein P0Y53_09895 [Pseudobacter sp.]